MGIQINGNTDIISATDGGLTVSGADLGSASASSLNISGIVTASGFSGNVNATGLSTFSSGIIGNVTGNINSTGVSTITTLSATTITGVSTIGVTTVSTTNLTVNGNSYPSAGPLSNRNLIINGDMQVAQRGTSSASSGYYTVDRWSNISNGGAFTQSQETLTSGSPYDEGFRNFLRMTNTTASTAASAYRIMSHNIEAQNVAQSGWNYTSTSSYITFLFWVRSSVSQNFYSQISSSDGTIQMYPFETGVLAANTWTKITKTIPGNANITIDNDNGAGLSISLAPFYGTDRTDNSMVVDSWQTFASNNRSPDYDTTWAGTTNATFDITGVQLEVGTVATPFEHRSYADELRLCQRYFETSFNGGVSVNNTSNAGIFAWGGSNTGDTTSFIGSAFVFLAVPKRSSPTVTIYDLANPRNTGKCSRHRLGVAQTPNQDVVVAATPGINGFDVYSGGSSAGTGILLHFTASSEL